MIISAPGFTKYKQKCYIFANYFSVCMYKANKGVVVVVVVVVVKEEKAGKLVTWFIV